MIQLCITGRRKPQHGRLYNSLVMRHDGIHTPSKLALKNTFNMADRNRVNIAGVKTHTYTTPLDTSKYFGWFSLSELHKFCAAVE